MTESTRSRIESTPFQWIGGVFALIAVGMGAFGAHGLNETLTANNSLATWKTAADYQMWHALAIILVGLVSTRKVILGLFTVGILLFSGSLYILALGGPTWLGPITPLGGLSFMLAWFIFARDGFGKVAR